MDPDRVAQLQRHLTTQLKQVCYINVRSLVEKKKSRIWKHGIGTSRWMSLNAFLRMVVWQITPNPPSEVAEIAHDCLVSIRTSPLLTEASPQQ